MFKKTWPQPHDDVLRTMAAQGKTNAEIARLLNEKFGTTYSRNAVIGRASRMGLRSESGDKGGDASPKPKRPRKRSLSADDKIRIAARSNLPASYIRAAQPRMVCEEPVICLVSSDFREVPLIIVEGCRWPSGDGSGAVPFTFCNAPLAFKGCAYCAEHRRMALRHAA